MHTLTRETKIRVQRSNAKVSTAANSSDRLKERNTNLSEQFLRSSNLN